MGAALPLPPNHMLAYTQFSCFWKWMYPEGGGEEPVSDAALGVIILWFCWCGKRGGGGGMVKR